MKRFLPSQLCDESERSSNVVRGDVILALDFLEGHASSQAPHHDCDRYACAPNDWFAAGDSRIEDDGVRNGHMCQMIVLWQYLSSATAKIVPQPSGADSLIMTRSRPSAGSTS
jgi:hypothetical protein